MAEIHFLTGTKPTAADLQAENTDRAKLVKPLSYVDFPMMSEGEMETFLLADRDRILSQFYQGTPQGAAYRQAFERKRDALAAGLHRGSFNFFGAKSKTRPASGWLPLAAKGVDLRKGFTALFDDAEAGAERASVGVIPQVDCNTLYPAVNFPPGIENTPAYAQLQAMNAERSAKRDACNQENQWRKILNDHLEKSAAHPLYNFATSSDKQVPTVAAKAVLHSNSISSLASLSKIAKSNIDIWQTNGILAASIAKGAGPATPQDAIAAIKKAEADGIGFVLTTAAVIAIISAIAAAATAAAALITAIKAKQPTAGQIFENTTQGWGTPTWGPEKSDWIYIDPNTGQQIDPNTATGNNLLSNDNLPIILLGVGGAALLIGSKK